MKILILLLLVSCGKDENYQRCFTKEEALSHCIVTRISDTNESSSLARMYCEPQFLIESCYKI